MTIRFDDGAAYERGMGVWSRLTGQDFLEWIDPPAGLRWIDIGCGNGAFTELLMQRCAPSRVDGIDPSPAQIAYARTRPGTSGATFQEGNAMALPFGDAAFDAASMALVIFFVPEPAKGVAEMARVVRSGGLVSAYAWNFATGGFPYGLIQEALRAHGITPPLPPNAAVAQEDALRALWHDAGLQQVVTTTITVQRTFESLDEYWTASAASSALKSILNEIPPEALAPIRETVRAGLKQEADGRVTHIAWAAAVAGRVP